MFNYLQLNENVEVAAFSQDEQIINEVNDRKAQASQSSNRSVDFEENEDEEEKSGSKVTTDNLLNAFKTIRN